MVRCDVEGGMSGDDLRRSNSHASQLLHLSGGTLLDRDLLAGNNIHVNGRKGCGDVKGNLVLAGEHSNRIGSDLVGHITVGGNAVSAHNRCLNLSLLQDRKSTRLNSSHLGISYAVFCLKKKKK